LGGKKPLYRLLKAWALAKARASIAYRAVRSDNRSGRIPCRPWNKLVTGERTPLGPETATSSAARLALASEAAGKTLKSP